ncbi:unnamed protein product, partial [Ectocarpus sp. 12 AP-2014]
RSYKELRARLNLNLPHLLPYQPFPGLRRALALAMGLVAFLLILAAAVAVQEAGGEEPLELQECSSSITQLLPMVHPPVPETSVTLVRELMDPFS